MVIDHVFAAIEVIDLGGLWGDVILVTRLTITRAAMPIFMVVSGITLVRYGVKSKRVLQAAVAALLINAMWITAPMGAEPPDILILWVVAAATFSLWGKCPLPAIILGFIQAHYLPVQWGGYQPGTIVMFMAVGTLAASVTLPKLTSVGADRLLSFMGRHPLSFYVAHVTVIWLVVFTSAQLGIY